MRTPRGVSLRARVVRSRAMFAVRIVSAPGVSGLHRMFFISVACLSSFLQQNLLGGLVSVLRASSFCGSTFSSQTGVGESDINCCHVLVQVLHVSSSASWTVAYPAGQFVAHISKLHAATASHPRDNDSGG